LNFEFATMHDNNSDKTKKKKEKKKELKGCFEFLKSLLPTILIKMEEERMEKLRR
jgi:hypothetical protein